jgi:hypothetical protein
VVAAAALAGCHPTTIDPNKDNGDDSNAPVVNAAAVALPPSIVATKRYRCADNSVVTVDYLSDNKSANVRTGKDDVAPTQVTTTDPSKPMTAAGGYSVTGSATSNKATIAVPGHPSQACNA